MQHTLSKIIEIDKCWLKMVSIFSLLVLKSTVE